MLTKEQKLALKTIFNSPLAKIATWGGGTALSEIYLKHRRSDDIDIILSDLPPTIELNKISQKIKRVLNASQTASFTKMNRFQFVFFCDKKQLKLEFAYYPFIKLRKSKKVDNFKIESLFDIAVSKTLASYQREEVKDVLDIYFLLKNKFSLSDLIKGVEKKFNEKIDSAHLLAKLNNNLQNFSAIKPLLYKKTNKKTIEDFFQKEFNRLKI